MTVNGTRKRPPAIRLNFREVYPVHSWRHPVHLDNPPTDALCVLWLEGQGASSDPRFAYLSHSRAAALHAELGRILQGEPNAQVERARRMISRRGEEVSGA